MYKHYIYCIEHDYEIETEGKVVAFVDEEMVYIQDGNKEVFVVNKSRLEAISLNNGDSDSDRDGVVYQTININSNKLIKDVVEELNKIVETHEC